MIKILLVDDHSLIRTGLRHVLASEEGYAVVGEAASGEEALELVAALLPDLVMMDVNMPGMGGIEATRRISRDYPEIKVIALTMLSETPIPSCLHDAGALGFLVKGCDAEEIFDAIKSVRQGRPYLAMAVAQRIAGEGFMADRSSPFVRLSARETEVMLLILQGKRNQDIADILYISPKTVSTYRQRIHEQLNVASDVELALLAMRYGMLSALGAL